MKRLISHALVLMMVLAFTVPALAAPSYDSTVYVDITPDDQGIVLIGDSVDVTFTVNVTNISKSGDLPQIVVTPCGDNTEGIAASNVTKIITQGTGVFEFTVTYTEIGDYDFWVEIKNMQGNSGKWNYEFVSEKVTVSIVDFDMVDAFNKAIAAGNYDVVDGEGIYILGYKFTKNGKIDLSEPPYPTLTCVIDGVTYRLTSNNKGMQVD